MSAPELNEALLAFLRERTESTNIVKVNFDGDALEFGLREVKHFLRLVDGVYTFEMFERGASNGLELITEELGAVERFLAVDHGQGWRYSRGLRRLVVAYGKEGLPPGYEVIDEGGMSTVRWSQDGRDCRASVRYDAVALARTLPFSVEEVIASFKDRKGRPVFASPTKRFWRRRPA